MTFMVIIIVFFFQETNNNNPEIMGDSRAQQTLNKICEIEEYYQVRNPPTPSPTTPTLQIHDKSLHVTIPLYPLVSMGLPHF